MMKIGVFLRSFLLVLRGLSAGCCPLHTMCVENKPNKNKPALVQPLITTGGVGVNVVTNDGDTPLQFAARNGHAEVAKVMLAYKDVEVNPATIDGFTPLHAAVKEGHAEVAKDLLAHKDI